MSSVLLRSHHRDVNHTFASMESDDPNPFVSKMGGDASLAWYYKQKGSISEQGNVGAKQA